MGGVRERINWATDIAAVVVISIAAVLTAWCGYESARWSELQAESYNNAMALRIQASEARDRGNALTSIDVGLYVQYLTAKDAGRTTFAKYLSDRFRPEFKTALNAWLATKPDARRDAPKSPFSMPEYLLKSEAEARTFDSRATETFNTAVKANQISDRYVLLTVSMATVSFLGGVGSKLRYPRHVVMVSLAFVILIVATAIMLGLPTR
jgi:hypothetical protein